MITPIGTIELRVLRDWEGRFSTELFELYLQSEKALVLALAEMYIQGVSRKRLPTSLNSSWEKIYPLLWSVHTEAA